MFNFNQGAHPLLANLLARSPYAQSQSTQQPVPFSGVTPSMNTQTQPFNFGGGRPFMMGQQPMITPNIAPNIQPAGIPARPMMGGQGGGMPTGILQMLMQQLLQNPQFLQRFGFNNLR